MVISPRNRVYQLYKSVRGTEERPRKPETWIKDRYGTWISVWDITYHLLTESEVITGKSQTEALMYTDRAMARSIHAVAHTEEVSVCWYFSFTYWKDSYMLSVFFLLYFRPCASSFSSSPEKKNFITRARSLQENLALSAANQSTRTIVAT